MTGRVWVATAMERSACADWAPAGVDAAARANAKADGTKEEESCMSEPPREGGPNGGPAVPGASGHFIHEIGGRGLTGGIRSSGRTDRTRPTAPERKRVVSGKSVSFRVNLGGCRINKKKKQ